GSGRARGLDRGGLRGAVVPGGDPAQGARRARPAHRLRRRDRAAHRVGRGRQRRRPSADRPGERRRAADAAVPRPPRGRTGGSGAAPRRRPAGGGRPRGPAPGPGPPRAGRTVARPGGPPRGRGNNPLASGLNPGSVRRGPGWSTPVTRTGDVVAIPAERPATWVMTPPARELRAPRPGALPRRQRSGARLARPAPSPRLHPVDLTASRGAERAVRATGSSAPADAARR